MTETATITVDLGYDNDPMAELPVSRIFGEMIKLATPTLTHYQSDLFHDAVWLDRRRQQFIDLEQGQPSFEFFYSFDAWGTCIGIDPVTIVSRSNAYSFRFRFIDGGHMQLIIERLS